jgi:dolichyl-phosphate-mannose-protein mannosyltransferase
VDVHTGSSSPSFWLSLRAWIPRAVKWAEAHTTWGLVSLVAFALALGLRRIWLEPLSMQTGQTPDWWTIATNLIGGQGYASCVPRYFPFCGPINQMTASREPMPVLIFAGLALLTNQSLLAAIVLELLTYVVIPLFVFLLTRRLTNGLMALLSAFVWVIYRPALDLIPQVSGDLLATLFTVAGLFFVFRARSSNRTFDWIAAGLALGLGVLSRSAVLAVAGVIVMGLLVERSFAVQSLRERLRPSFTITMIVGLMLIPWIAHNEVVFGEPVIGSTLMGYNLYRHNHMLGSDNYFRYVGGSEGDRAIQALVANHPELRGTENEAQMDTFYRSQAIQVIISHPMQYVSLSAYRFLPLWFNWQVKEADGNQADVKDYLMILEQGSLLALALFGLRGKSKQLWPLWASVAAFSLVYMAIDSQMRYLLPVMPLVLSLSAVGAMNLVRSFVKAS